MNIKEAKAYIKDTVKLYLKKDEYGDYRIPVVRQRPIFLLGAPGIGKTAIMEQIASELDIALVSYSMTHHTRQSALGLPFITQKEYGENTYSVSEYTMSEIIASVYDTMKESGINEGILFLDEINCVSETLYPSMLQFLQYKTFGRHAVPEGWVIVTAGNPQEFNRAVREFDVVTLDRLKVLDVEADYKAWKEYAVARNLHGAIINFLDANRDYFYKIETTVEGRSYVTARGWEDLSEILYLYEEEGIAPGEHLMSQYLKNDEVVREFAAYYDLYNKYKETYKADALLEGNFSDETILKAKNAKSDERLALEGLLLDRIEGELSSVTELSGLLRNIRPALTAAKEGKEEDIAAVIKEKLDDTANTIKTRSRAGSLSYADKKKLKAEASLLKELFDGVSKSSKPSASLSEIYNSKVTLLKEKAGKAGEHLKNLFSFTNEAFGEESNEMLVAVTELTVNEKTAEFLSTFGSEEYEHYNKILMVNDREKLLRKEIAGII